MTFIFFVNIIAMLFSFFILGALFGALFSPVFRKKLKLLRSHFNPIIKPGLHPWSAESVMNPAALALGGRTHLIYRAIGMDGASRLGYASSADGVVFDEQLPYPIFIVQKQSSIPESLRRYSPVMYPSGGSWGGCEDPRTVAINGKVYVTFNMFENWILRVGYISIEEEDFLAKRFYKWDGPYKLSHGARDKNWVLFPEKINGQFAVLHSIIGERTDRVRIEYIDDLKELALRKFESPDPQQVPDQRVAWHNHVRSAGPPPVKTDKGWLVFYHAHTEKDSYKYKLGAMLLDVNDPEQILCRAVAPVLEPDAHYENAGKPGIIYACGAVVRNGQLYVYYGGADKVVCVATAPLKKFLNALVEGNQTHLATHSVLTT